MNYTKNHHLPQWEESDRILRSDFNDAMENIDAGLTQGPAGAAEAAAKAQTTADQALANAAKAQTKADAAYSPAQPPYVVGSYTGTGQSQSIVLGFRPRFVIVSGNHTAYANNYARTAGEQSASGQITFSSNGFSVGRNAAEEPSGNETPPYLIKQGVVYSYIAFR